MMMRSLFLALSALSALSLASTELVLLQQISRHGVRSPKTGYENYCPSDPWRWQWDTANAQLSGVGDLEEAAVGEVTRTLYGGLIGAYNATRHIVQATDSDRVLQSAEVAMSRLFPPGGGPEKGLPSRPTFVPIHTIPWNEDSLLSVESGACDKRASADKDEWWNTDGADILAAGAAAQQPLTDFCGKSAKSSKAIKMQVDGIGFDRDEGFLKNATVSDGAILAAQNLSIVLQRGDFATDAARTYLAGDLPATLLANMKYTLDPEKVGPHEPSYYAYFVHRHSLYAIAEFFGWAWKQHGIPEGQVQTGTTLYVELHRNTTGGLTVQLQQWAPHCGAANYTECPRTPVILAGCSMAGGAVCSMDEFGAIITERTTRTGDWKQLCGEN